MEEETDLDTGDFDLGGDIEYEDITKPGDTTAKHDNDAWLPYPSKVHFLLDMIDTLPRLRISGSIMKTILWPLRECEVKNIPSYKKFRDMQENLRKEAGIPTIQWQSPQGNTFSFNDPIALVANDWTNPLVAPHLRVYPSIPKDGIISETWHASKWRRDMDRRFLSPMYANGDQHFYVDELAKLKDGRFVVPIRWLMNEADHSVYADMWVIHISGDLLATIDHANTVLIPASNLEFNMLDLQDRTEIPTWSAETIAAGHPQRMPNPDRALADGDELYTSFIDIFGDDVSGNQSKSWNKHWNVYITHRNLPRKMLQQQYNVHFVSTSQHASVSEQFHGIYERIRSTHDRPVKIKQRPGRDIQIRLRPFCGPGDNPSQSEITGHIGGNGNHPCRKCHVGGTQKDKETLEGFRRFFEPGIPRSSTENIACLEAQLAVASLGKAQRVKEMQSASGVKDSFTQHWIDYFLSHSRSFHKENPTVAPERIQAILQGWVSGNSSLVYNPYLQAVDWDITHDTPVELLHTVLLGVVKYSWHMAHTSFSAENKKTYTMRLGATERRSLSADAFQAPYMVQYANSLVGRQLKVLAQVNTFHIHDLVSANIYALARAVGELTALLWFPEIRNMEIYLCDIRTAVANVLDYAALVNPSKIIKKIKYHYLTHIEEDIQRFGPLIGVMTENYESYNSVFRACSVLSNHLSPSRDIAHQLSRQETAKHILSGGSWFSHSSNGWVEPGFGVQRLIEANPHLRRLHGWPGSSRHTVLNPKVKTHAGKWEYKALRWTETSGVKAVNPDPEWESLMWYPCKKLISQYSDACGVGSWVFATSPFAVADETLTGKIVSILRCVNNVSQCIVLLDVFEMASTRHPIFDMPVLSRRLGEARVVAVSGKAILFDYNVQHDCYAARCSSNPQELIQQNHAQAGTTQAVIVHAAPEQYVINTHSLHNPHLIRQTVSRQLIAPVLKHIDRDSLHNEQARSLQTARLRSR
ncbi:hypothetical protein AGABI1DRAFT_103438 [Agaricus bisporus var. burnettii JB137-S8]|uniref:Uncharacterized protein n=2 Tax=Agaricus bisporus TaxID=5341 RepID=K5WG98_AGABU|nr:uncharacterized protein AGABI1DRAFT_103438 [Agaricus bisporus var. burnettii JB137-S8]EKM74296.1 hypothetical protein AGABI1DRAFT_103438 [Agaricus bisporus var. burnettii JB137-S8]